MDSFTKEWEVDISAEYIQGLEYHELLFYIDGKGIDWSVITLKQICLVLPFDPS